MAGEQVRRWRATTVSRQRNRPVTPAEVTGPQSERRQSPPTSTAILPSRFPPCGCHLIATCVHIDHDAPRLSEPADLGPRCAGTDQYACGRFTVQQLAALGLRGVCCADLDRDRGAA
jgi:hypothetical protein